MMAITVKHSKVSTVPDGDDTSVVRPSDWNADHQLVGTVPVANGGTGASTATGAINALLPSQTGNSGKVLSTDGTNTSWSAASVGTVTSVTGTAPVNVATGTTTPVISLSTTGSGNVVLATGATQANPTISNYENFTPTTAPAYSEGRVWYDSTEKALAFYNDSSALAVHVSQDLIFKVINNTGSTIANGAPVYITGTSSGQTYPNVALAKADVAATSSVIGLTNGAIANGATGYVSSQGTIDNVNTSTFTVGQVLYLSPYSAGQLMNTIPPTGITVQVGVATYIDSSAGHIYVKQTTPLSVPASIITGTLGVPNGGTGATTLTGYVKGSGTSALTAASTIPTTDLSGTISNAQLANSAITINGTSTSLGGSISVGTVTSVTGTSPVVSSGGATPAISMPAATTSVSGYLTSTDWNTFNNKGSGSVTSVAATAGTGISVTGSPITTSGTLNITNTAPDQTVVLTAGTGISTSGTYPNFTITNTSPSSGGTVTSVTGTAPVVSSGGNTPAISMAAATTSVPGYLTAADWTTFNGKQAALVSGTNIKTINTNSILGSGDLTIAASPAGSTTQVQYNNAGALAGSAGFLYDNTNGILNLSGSTGALTVPTGTTAQRPSTLAAGMIRYNTTTGQTEVYSGTNWVTLSTQTITATYLIVAGGAGGGGGIGGGGGAGGLLTGSTVLTTSSVYTVTVGGGGSGGTNTAKGSAGNNSSITGLTTVIGGGGGGAGQSAPNYGGNSGGSGGGGGNNVAGGAATSGQGSAGGTSTVSSGFGGGGGASAVGNNGSANAGGSGGAGTASTITGSSVTYAGGGGGGGYLGTGGAGGTGGGGAGTGGDTVGTAGTANTGGGGGGGGYTATGANGGAGGSGVVIISLPTSQYTGTTTGSPTVTTSGANTILTFTASGSYTA